ncbi:MAG TPA: DUF3127 domain-containing protein [Tenuifilaceae bacterium]|jgi:hypothetical protein|nr:DUF3127 domain-containing protein [Tenuifilaceae bacterium]HOA10153.1 DUF3127 domain-containing protein [Tenuifilaceae bacterium]HOC36989.1 DUF3127 domain-containing protein [Tenuifilaceae bacterium]HOG72601.1 DUF3127 domain-containing protein [Tenuifilaceae bacterium]HOW20715.1 DUF3127 domain-containing protein [Tenuifilaceae bacterium]
MSMEITGKLLQKLNRQTGEGKNGAWVKQEFIVETLEQYPRKICIAAWGTRVDDLDRLQPGNILKISVNVESREFNGRWYTDVKAWRIEKQDDEAPQSDGGKPGKEDMNLPPESSKEYFDDLPF